MPVTSLMLERMRLRENHVFFALTVIVGLLSGLAAVLFTLAIDWTSRTLFGFDPSSGRLLMVPVLASLAAGLLLATLFPEARGSGVPQTKAAFHLQRGMIPARVPFGKFLTGALSVGGGHSMGREGPSVQIGAGLASVVGQWIRLPPHRIRELVPVGAAGALAAAFNTPVSAVIFTLEELIGDLNAPLIGSTVIASVASVIVARSIQGNEPFFRVPVYHLVHPAELVAYAGLGVAGGVLSVVFCRTLLGVRRLTRGVSRAGSVLLPVSGGLLIGLMLLVVPEVMGVGYESIDQALNGGLVFRTLVLLCAAKMVATLISYTSGNAGGIFAPSLYIGAMAGGAIGTIARWVAPFQTADPGAYALVGMGAVFAGIVRAPMTSVFMMFEITQDYQILVPLMVANMLSFAISRRYQPDPVYHALLAQDGVHLPAVVEFGDVWVAADAMQRDVVLLPPGQTVAQALHVMRDRPDSVLFVGTTGNPGALVTVSTLRQAVASGRESDRLDAIAAPAPAPLWIDDTSDTVLQRLTSAAGPIPVLARDGEGGDLEGALSADDVVRLLAARAGPASA